MAFTGILLLTESMKRSAYHRNTLYPAQATEDLPCSEMVLTCNKRAKLLLLLPASWSNLLSMKQADLEVKSSKGELPSQRRVRSSSFWTQWDRKQTEIEINLISMRNEIHLSVVRELRWLKRRPCVAWRPLRMKIRNKTGSDKFFKKTLRLIMLFRCYHFHLSREKNAKKKTRIQLWIEKITFLSNMAYIWCCGVSWKNSGCQW